MINSKVCTSCRKEKPIDEFGKSKGGKYGHKSWCKKCAYAVARKWAIENAEKLACTVKAWKEKNRDKLTRQYREQHIKYYAEHREQLIDYSKRYSEAHPEKRREIGRRARQKHPDQAKKWRKANPDKVKNNQQKFPERVKARYAVRGAIRNKTLQHANTLKCCRCPNPAKEYHHYRGYSKEHWLDVVPVCRACHEVLDRGG